MGLVEERVRDVQALEGHLDHRLRELAELGGRRPRFKELGPVAGLEVQDQRPALEVHLVARLGRAFASTSAYRTDWPSTLIESRPVAVWSSVSYFESIVSANVATASPRHTRPKEKACRTAVHSSVGLVFSPKTQDRPVLFFGAVFTSPSPDLYD